MLEGTSRCLMVQPPAQAGAPREGSLVPCQGCFWRSSRTETTKVISAMYSCAFLLQFQFFLHSFFSQVMKEHVPSSYRSILWLWTLLGVFSSYAMHFIPSRLSYVLYTLDLVAHPPVLLCLTSIFCSQQIFFILVCCFSGITD